MQNSKDDLGSHLQGIIDTAIDGIVTIDAEGIVEMMNPAAAELFGFTPDEILGKNIKVLMPPPYKAEHDGYIARYHETQEPRIIGVGREVQGLKKNGDVFPFRLAVSEVVLNDRIIFTGVIHDLTDIKKAEQRILELNKSLENTVSRRTYELENTVNKLLSTNKAFKDEIVERKIAEQKLNDSQEELRVALNKEKELNELKSRFVSMASHEFRTPLTSILSSAAIIGRYDKEEQQPQREKHINRIKASVANLTGILNDFLSLSKLEEGKVNVNYGKLDLEELCQSVIEETTQLLKTDQKIIHKIHGQHSEIYIDERILKNIVFNLVSNAIKYSNKDIECDFYLKSDHFELRVRDYGIGIPQEDQKYLFGRFFRAGNVTNIQGTGLGLNIVQRYVEILKGSIDFESKHEEGTTFYVKIPYGEVE